MENGSLITFGSFSIFHYQLISALPAAHDAARVPVMGTVGADVFVASEEFY
jgi:hypothetical protein